MDFSQKMHFLKPPECRKKSAIWVPIVTPLLYIDEALICSLHLKDSHIYINGSELAKFYQLWLRNIWPIFSKQFFFPAIGLGGLETLPSFNSRSPPLLFPQ